MCRCGNVSLRSYNQTIDKSPRGTLLSSRRGCSGSDNFQYFSRTVMHLRSYLPEADAA